MNDTSEIVTNAARLGTQIWRKLFILCKDRGVPGRLENGMPCKQVMPYWRLQVSLRRHLTWVKCC